MAIVVECPRCRRVTHFADNDAGLAVGCVSCGQVTRVPDPRPKIKVAAVPPVRASAPGVAPMELMRVRASAGRPVAYAVGVLLVLGTIMGLGYVKYRSVFAGGTAAAPAVASTKAATSEPVTRPAAVAESMAAVSITSQSKPPANAGPAPDPIAERKAEAIGRVVGFVGLDRLELNGRYSVDSYNSAAVGYRAGASRSMAPLLSNLKVRLYGTGQVQGFVRLGKGGDFKKGDDVTVTSPVVDDGADAGRLLEAPAVDVATAKAANDNDQLPEKYLRGGSLVVAARKTVGLPAGVYYLKDLVIEPRATLVLDGPVTVVLRGQMIVQGNIETNDQRPPNLKIRAAGGDAPVVINNQSELYLDLYAPGRTIEVYGGGDIYGSVVGKTLRMQGERGLHFDESILPVLEPAGHGN
jgi:hypothetical protein